jgi:hypothetical protein
MPAQTNHQARSATRSTSPGKVPGNQMAAVRSAKMSRTLDRSTLQARIERSSRCRPCWMLTS